MTTFNFHTFEEANEFAQSINSRIVLYTKRAGDQFWKEEETLYSPIEAQTDDEEYNEWERTERAQFILTDMGDFKFWFKDFRDYIDKALDNLDIEKAQELVQFATDVKDAIEVEIEEGEEAVAIINDGGWQYEVIRRYPTIGNYDGLYWTIGVPDPDED